MSSFNTNSQNNLDIEEGGQPRLPTLTLSDDVEQQTMPAVSTPLPDIDQSNQLRRIGLEQVDGDDTDMPLPTLGIAEDISNRAEPPKQKGSKIEQLDDDDVGPEPPTAMFETSLNAVDRSNKVSITSLAPTNNNDEHNPPTPFNSSNFEEDVISIAKKKAKDEMNQQKPPAVSNNEVEGEEVLTPPLDRDTMYEPPREVIEGREGMSDNTNRRGWEDIEAQQRRRAQDIES